MTKKEDEKNQQKTDDRLWAFTFSNYTNDLTLNRLKNDNKSFSSFLSLSKKIYIDLSKL
jgi:hypothetical protein